MNAGRAATALALALALASCVQPVHRVSMDESFMKRDPVRKAWRRIAVLPFAGDPVFRRTAPEWLAFRVRGHGLFEIVDPSLAEIELGKKGISFGDAGASAGQAQRSGQLLGVDGVIFGSIDPSKRAGGGQAEVRARVVEVATGKVVADIVRSGVAQTRFGRRGVMSAVDLVAEDLAPVFHAAAGKGWTLPRETRRDGPEPARREAPGTGR